MAQRKKTSQTAITHLDRREAMAAAAGRFNAFRPASQVLSAVRSVPTIFPGFDHATKVRGMPIERFTLLHGPSGQGKTYFSLGLIKSFLKLDHYALLIDAERTTPITWVRKLMPGLENHPGFFGERPDTYEKTVRYVREWLMTIVKAREDGVISPDTAAIIVVDSIRKLVPEKLFATIMKLIKEAEASKIKDIGGRINQIKAAMNAAWMDEVTILLEKAQACMVAIARERVKPNAQEWERRAGLDYEIGGGTAIYYDSSLVMRAERAGYVTDKKRSELGEHEKAKIFGERHRLTVYKTKISGHEDKYTSCFFHTSNGVLIPFGFDTARDVLEMAERFEIVRPSKQKEGQKGGGSWLVWGRHRWQGRNTAVRKLSENPQLLSLLENEVREQFTERKTDDFDSDGVVSE